MNRYGLIGRSLAHSFSPGYFQQKFQAEGIDATYESFELESIQAFPELLRKHDLTGLNVTIPYKEEILPYLTRIDSAVRTIGAVNVIHLNGGERIGYNTDWIGFLKSIESKLQPQHQRALVLGTGGASKAILYALDQLDISVTRVSRSPGAGDLTYADITREIAQTHTVVVQTTPVGMFPDVEAVPPYPLDELSPDHLVMDLIYNPAETAFLHAAKSRGAITLNGLEMLHIQAEESWKVWNS